MEKCNIVREWWQAVAEQVSLWAEFGEPYKAHAPEHKEVEQNLNPFKLQ